MRDRNPGVLDDIETVSGERWVLMYEGKDIFHSLDLGRVFQSLG